MFCFGIMPGFLMQLALRLWELKADNRFVTSPVACSVGATNALHKLCMTEYY
jgi:hypothetical protein